MGLNVYAGSLTRYYSKDWRPVQQNEPITDGKKMAPHPSKYPRALPSEQWDELQETNERWRDEVLKVVSAKIQYPVEQWCEDVGIGYYTHNLTWQSYFAVMISAACLSYSQALPRDIPTHEPLHQHPMFRKAYLDDSNPVSYLLRTEWWIPSQYEFIFTCKGPDGQPKTVSSTKILLRWLVELNNNFFHANEDYLTTWCQSEGPRRNESGNMRWKEGQYRPVYPFVSYARHGFAVATKAAQYSIQHHVPLLLHY
ncbi:MAG: hypothetical protein Q4P66_01940 [Actinomycetaceae bacterium]|nr:hypothetical protein [Actinomycetaceae bacterium]